VKIHLTSTEKQGTLHTNSTLHINVLMSGCPEHIHSLSQQLYYKLYNSSVLVDQI